MMTQVQICFRASPPPPPPLLLDLQARWKRKPRHRYEGVQEHSVARTVYIANKIQCGETVVFRHGRAVGKRSMLRAVS